MRFDATQQQPDMQVTWDADWNKMSDIYFWHLRAHYKAVIPLLEGNVLDIGCGPGFLAGWVYPNESHYTGIEISPQAILYGKKLFPGANFLCWDITAQKVPLPDQGFDTVVCSELLEHIEKHDFVLYEIKRLARNRVILTVPISMGGCGHVWPEWTIDDLTARSNIIGQLLEVRVNYEGNFMLAIVRRT